MARIRKWGSRRAGSAVWGRFRFRLPRIWSGMPVPVRRSPAFRAKRSSRGLFSQPSGARFQAGKRRAKFSAFYSQKAGKREVPAISQRKPRRRGRFWLVISLVMILAILQGIRYVERHLKPPIIHLAQIRVKQIATESINKAITSQVVNGGNAEDLIDWKSDKNGKISGFMLNYSEHMRITSQAADVIQSTLQQLHHQTEHIPLGQALGSPLIASFGPDVPIKIEPQGAVKVELDTRQQNAGINMILVEVYIRIVTELAVVIPFDMEPQVVDTEIPVSYLMVVGDVPMYYYDNQGQPVGSNGASAPGIAIPAPPSSGAAAGTSGEESPSGNGTGVIDPQIPQNSVPGSSAVDNTRPENEHEGNTGETD